MDRVQIVVEDWVATVTMQRPDKHNALDADMFRGLIGAQEELIARSEQGEIRAVVVCGAGPSFCAGLDFPAFMAQMGSENAMKPFERFADTPANFVQRMGYDWLRIPVPVIAALHGNVLGGGAQIALGADIRIAAPDTRIAIMEIVWGLIPDMSVTATLPKLVGMDVAKELIFTGRKVPADEAMRLGLVTQIAEDPLQRAQELAREIASLNPDAIRANKKLLEYSWKRDDGEGMLLEEELQKQILGSANQMEAVAARFEKRPGRFR